MVCLGISSQASRKLLGVARSAPVGVLGKMPRWWPSGIRCARGKIWHSRWWCDGFSLCPVASRRVGGVPRGPRCVRGEIVLILMYFIIRCWCKYQQECGINGFLTTLPFRISLRSKHNTSIIMDSYYNQEMHQRFLFALVSLFGFLLLQASMGRWVPSPLPPTPMRFTGKKKSVLSGKKCGAWPSRGLNHLSNLINSSLTLVKMSNGNIFFNVIQCKYKTSLYFYFVHKSNLND